jgi:membrane-bound lytic murein transglycosylase D
LFYQKERLLLPSLSINSGISANTQLNFLTQFSLSGDHSSSYINLKNYVVRNPTFYEYFLTKLSVMKINLREQIGLFCMLVLSFNLAYSQPHTDLFLREMPQDSLVIKTDSITKVDSSVSVNVSATVPLQPHFKNYVNKYLDINAEMLEDIRETNSAKFNTIQKILLQRKIPAGLLYLAIIESKLKNNATSHVGAAGIWQLMPATGRTLGLKVKGKIDERRNTYSSTVAAAAYLTELYKQFDDWLLVVAAYNCGAGNVFKAIRQSGSRDFWKLQGFLPAETRSHVKHFIATHFYYENGGSIVTLTKKERLHYLAALDKMVVKTGKAEDTTSQPVAAVLNLIK